MVRIGTFDEPCGINLMCLIFRVPLKPSGRRWDSPRRSSRIALCQTGLGIRPTTKLDITQRGETGEEQSSSSEQGVSLLQLTPLYCFPWPRILLCSTLVRVVTS